MYAVHTVLCIHVCMCACMRPFVSVCVRAARQYIRVSRRSYVSVCVVSMRVCMYVCMYDACMHIQLLGIM